MNILGPVNPYSDMAIFEQVENLVQFGISSGRLKPGVQLPGIRALSVDYEVNANTVARAYRDLEVLGIVDSRRGEGIFITAAAPRICEERCTKMILMRLHGVAREALAAGISKSEARRAVNAAFDKSDPPYAEISKKVLRDLFG